MDEQRVVYDSNENESGAHASYNNAPRNNLVQWMVEKEWASSESAEKILLAVTISCVLLAFIIWLMFVRVDQSGQSSSGTLVPIPIGNNQ